MSFADKVVLVTGASSGIGAVAAVLFAAEGADVAVVARTQAKLEAVAKKIQSHGRKALVIRADLSNDADLAGIISKTVEHFGKLDVLVNNAGMMVEGSILNGQAVKAYEQTMSINVRAVIQLTTLAAPHLIKTKGNVVNISSVVAQEVSKLATFMPYYVSKAALNHFTRCAALELATKGVRVNSVSPGPVDNEFLTNNGKVKDEQLRQAMIATTALGFMATDDEIAELILFVASDKARSITGSDYLIDNGRLLK